MPANLTHQYHKAEQGYRQASGPEEELRWLQEMLRQIPKHKGTDRLQADLKQKIRRAKEELVAESHQKRRGFGVRIPRQGAGRIVLIGAPNSGKSQFVRSCTRYEAEVADYPFTTRSPVPAMMPLEDVQVQLIDTPPITADLLDPATQGLIRGADLVLLLLDLAADDGLLACQEVVSRLAKTRTRLARESRLDQDDIGVSFTATLLLPTKWDVPLAAERWEQFQTEPLPDLPCYPISAIRGDGMDDLRQTLFERLQIVRVYTKSPTEKTPDFSQPYALRPGATVADVAALVHQDFARQLKSARIWSQHGHPGMLVKADHPVQDRDIIELHL